MQRHSLHWNTSWVLQKHWFHFQRFLESCSLQESDNQKAFHWVSFPSHHLVFFYSISIPLYHLWMTCGGKGDHNGTRGQSGGVGYTYNIVRGWGDQPFLTGNCIQAHRKACGWLEQMASPLIKTPIIFKFKVIHRPASLCPSSSTILHSSLKHHSVKTSFERSGKTALPFLGSRTIHGHLWCLRFLNNATIFLNRISINKDNILLPAIWIYSYKRKLCTSASNSSLQPQLTHISVVSFWC